MKLFGRLKPALVFLCSAAWLALFQSWGAFSDPDGFYHAKVALLVAAKGPLQAFPWLDLTTLGQSFADQHLLYHVALIPFVKSMDPLWGAQIAAVLFSALFATAFYLMLRAMRAPAPWLWTVLLLTLPHTLFRLTWAKATPLALVCFLLGLAALIWRRPWLAFVVGAVYALTHGGWVLLVGAQALYLIGWWGTKAFAFDESFTWKSLKTAIPFVATLAGIVLGLLIHPNARAELSFLWTQVVQVGVTTPYGHVIMGNEWNPPQIDDLIPLLTLPLLAFAIVLFGLLVARRDPLDRSQATLGAALLVAAAGPFALMLKSLRFLEYALPLIVLAIAALSSLVDWPLFARRARELLPKIATPLLVIVTLAFIIKSDVRAWQAIHDSGRSFDRFTPAIAWLSSQAAEGDRVYESDWDVFPELFYGDDRVRFVSGLDPTFLYSRNPSLSDAYFDLVRGTATSTAYHVIHDLAGASFVFVDLKNGGIFDRVIQADSRFVPGYFDANAKVYLVR